jgi:hypothetical protein
MSSGEHSPSLICCSWIRECTLTCYCIKMGLDSAVSIATRYGLDSPGIESQWGGGEIFHTHPDRLWGTPSLLYNGCRVFPGGKVEGAWRLPRPSSAKVKERVELYLYSTSGPSWPVIVWPLPLPYLLPVSKYFTSAAFSKDFSSTCTLWIYPSFWW